MTYTVEELRERAAMIRKAAPKTGSITPLEVTAEHLEWAADEIDRLVAQQDGTWQPIETAPKDNSAILVYCPMKEVNFTATAFWDTVAKEWRIAWTGIGNPPVKAGSPTHWMPIPAPPPR